MFPPCATIKNSRADLYPYMPKAVKAILIFAFFSSLAYGFRVPLANILSGLEAEYFPCRKTIAYSLGVFDERFGISKSDFFSDILAAERVWEDPAGRQLFIYSPDGDLKMNLVYDYRQEATVKLQGLGIVVNNTKASYDAVKAKYDELYASYIRDNSVFETRFAVLEERKKTYDAEVRYWNKRGDVPQDIYERLNNEKISIEEELGSINQLQANLNAQIEKINATVVVLNRLANSLNLNVARFNEVGGKNSGEFEEGSYRRGIDGQEINVYQFENKARLIRVLAHEFGHALGLNHVDDQKAIMYRLNQGTDAKTATADVLELKRACRIK